MTITVQPARNELTSNAGQTIFNYTFKIFSITDLNVYITPTGQAANDSTDLTTAYTVTGVDDEDGGTITLTVGANLNDLVTIVSNIPSLRTTDYQNNGDFRPDVVNADFDRVVSLVKKGEDLSGRALLLPQSQQGPKPLSLPNPLSQAIMRWKSDLSGLENIFVSDLSPGLVPNDEIIRNSTLSAVVASTNTKLGEVYILSDRGDGIFDVVLESTVTTNTLNIIQCVGAPTLALELRLNDMIHISHLGATGTGDETAIAQGAADLAFNENISIINLDTLTLSIGRLDLWSGVGLFNGGIINNSWLPAAVDGITVALYGGNIVYKVIFDGNFRNIGGGDNDDFTLYGTVLPVASSELIVGPSGSTSRGVGTTATALTLIHGCEFHDATGSHIVGTGVRGVTVITNLFLKYRDHAVYWQGHAFNDFLGLAQDNQSRLNVVANNTVQNAVYGEAGNGAFKIRNQVYDCVYVGNVFHLTGHAFVMDIGDPFNVDAYRDIAITGNSGSCSTFLIMFHDPAWTDGAIARGTINVSSNNVNCTSNPLRLGLAATPLTGRLKFHNNIIFAENGDVMTLALSLTPDSKSSFSFTECEFYETNFQFDTTSVWGTLTISRNKAFSTTNRFFLRFLAGAGTVNTDVCTSFIEDNNLEGYSALQLGDSASGEYGLMSRGDAYVSGNTIRDISGAQGTLLAGDNFGSEATLQGKTIVGENELLVNTKLFTNVVRSEIDEITAGALDLVLDGVASVFVPTANEFAITQNKSVITCNFRIEGSFTSLGGGGAGNELRVTGLPFISPRITPVAVAVDMTGVAIAGALMSRFDGNIKFREVFSNGTDTIISAAQVVVARPITLVGSYSYIKSE